MAFKWLKRKKEDKTEALESESPLDAPDDAVLDETGDEKGAYNHSETTDPIEALTEQADAQTERLEDSDAEENDPEAALTPPTRVHDAAASGIVQDP